jgi:hypothetical protein
VNDDDPERLASWIVGKLATMDEGQRLEIFAAIFAVFCRNCGRQTDRRCYCNDDS